MRMLTKTMTRILFKEKENRLYNIFEKMTIIFGILSGVGRVIWGLIRKQAISTSPGSSIRKINNGLFWLLLVFLCLAIISMIFMLVFGTYRFNVARNNFVLTQIKIPRIENANCCDLITVYSEKGEALQGYICSESVELFNKKEVSTGYHIDIKLPKKNLKKIILY